MTDRRKFLAAAALALPAASMAATETADPLFHECPRGVTGPNADRFPKVIVQDQAQRKAWFYEELLHQKLALVSFTSVKGEAHYPVLPNLVKVQEMLSERLGKDFFMYTLSTAPHQDTPEALAELAREHGVNWPLLTGDSDSVRSLLKAFNVHGLIHGLAWIGNEQTGRWLSKASRQHPKYIAEAVARLSTGEAFKPFLIDMRSVRT
ncbi:MAG: SCO family protein [Methylococcales bacterium]|nr:SCO family protein [Methylococcales bacterium]